MQLPREIDFKTEYCDEATGIYLRPITYADTEDIVRWRNQPDVRKNFIYQKDFTKEGHETWMREQVETGKVAQFIVCDLETDKAYGSCYIRDITTEHSKGEFGMFLGEADARGRGIGTAIQRLSFRYGFEELGLHRLYMRVVTGNSPSLGSCENNSVTVEGVLKDDVFINGRYYDVVLLGIINPRDL